jgi:hypothetical protein
VSASSSGTSPYSTSTWCAVRNLWHRLLQRIAGAELLRTAAPSCNWPSSNSSRTRSPPCPYTTWIDAGSRLAATSSTCASIGVPASGCSTFGMSDCMRLPWPAARITIDSGALLGVAAGAVSGAVLVGLRDILLNCSSLTAIDAA